MFASRASADRPLTPRASIFSSGATWLYHSWLARDLRWVMFVGLVYALAVVAATLCLHRYFSQTWDVETFAAAGRSLSSPDWTALYAQTRGTQQWPYAYPPLHAALIAPLLMLAAWMPDWLLVRIPPLLADIGVGLLIYILVARKTQAPGLARLALTAWLLNPVTWYDTAVQGHFEAEWLFFVLLAYLLVDARRSLIWPTLALAAAFLFKQVAILFILPYWIALLVHSDEPDWLRRLAPVGLSATLWAAPVLLVSLPFLLYSPDYLYMNLQYVAQVPLQTQSWLVLLAGWFGAQFWPLQHSTLLVALVAVVIAFFALRRGMNLYRVGLLIALAFFVLSQKVMGYYYVMLLPFALVELIPNRRLSLLTLFVAAMAWISLSPYFAPWAAPAHWPVYAVLGTLNSLFWLGAAIYVWRLPATEKLDGAQVGDGRSSNLLACISITLFAQAVAAALLQPLIANPTSPIRAPLVPPALASVAQGTFLALLALALAILAVTYLMLRRRAAEGRAFRPILLVPLVYLPLYFLTFTLTKESTAALELLLKSLGM